MSRTRITVNAGGGEVVLADFSDTIRGAPEVQTQHDMQVVKYFRGKKITVIDRGNEQCALSFTVEKEWPTLEAARAWRLDARRLVPRSGDVSISMRGYGPGQFVRRMPNAAVQIAHLPNSGVTTRTLFTILAGEVTT